jgi:transposase
VVLEVGSQSPWISRLLTGLGHEVSVGGRVGRASAESFVARAAEDLPEALQAALGPVIEEIAQLTMKIRHYDRRIGRVTQQRYPETELLRQVDGVGPITALAFVLKVEDPRRFGRSRNLGPYLGLVPRRDQSGARDPQLRITKQGDPFLRRLLIQCAHYILGPFGKDCALRRHGLRITARGGPHAKKRAAVAVARNLAVLLHHLWQTTEVYEPLHGIATEHDRAA